MADDIEASIEEKESLSGSGKKEGTERTNAGRSTANESFCERFKFLFKPVQGTSDDKERKSYSLVLLPETYYLYALLYFWFWWAVMIVTTLAFSKTYDPDNNPVKTRDGYNMICVYWDFAPSTLFSVPLFTPLLIFTTIFVVLSILRMYNLYKTEHIITEKAFKTYRTLAIMMNCFVLLVPWTLSVTPYESLVLHTIPYLCLIIALWLLNALQNYYYHKNGLYESWKHGKSAATWSTMTWVYTAVLGVIISYMFLWALLNLIGMEVKALSFLHLSQEIPWFIPIGKVIEIFFLLMVAVVPIVFKFLIAPQLRNRCVKITLDSGIAHDHHK